MIRGDHENKFFLYYSYFFLYSAMKIDVSTLQLRVICCQTNVQIMSIEQKWFLQF